MISIDTFGSLVDAIYEAGLDSQQWPATLAHLAAATRVSVSDLKMADIGRVRFTMFSAGMDPAAIEAYNKYYYRLDPITPELERKPAGALVVAEPPLPVSQEPDRDLVGRESHVHGLQDHLGGVFP